MEDNNDIDLVGGICNDRQIYSDIATKYSYTFVSVTDTDIYCCDNFIKLDDQLNIYKTNLVLNLFISKTQVLKDHPWDNKLNFEEHMPFFVNLYKNNVKCAISYNLIFNELTDERRTYLNINSPYNRINHNIKYYLKYNLKILNKSFFPN